MSCAWEFREGIGITDDACIDIYADKRLREARSRAGLDRARPSSPPSSCRPRSMWQDGTGFPEPALDQFNQVTSGEALRWLLGGMSFFVALGTYTKLSDPEAKRPYVRVGWTLGLRVHCIVLELCENVGCLWLLWSITGQVAMPGDQDVAGAHP